MTTTLGGRSYVIPADAVPCVGRGLSADLFDTASLLREQAGGRFPVVVRYEGRVPALPGVTITSAVFTAPAGAKVSLRTSAGDAVGGSITETLTNAYQISS